MRNLRTRLLLLIALALGPLLLFQIYNEHADRQIRMRIMQDEALRIAGLVDAQLLRIIEGAEEVLDVLGNAPDVQDGVPGQCARLVTNVLAHSKRYAGLIVLDLDGHALCEEEPIDHNRNLSDRAYFQRALAGGEVATGDFTKGRRSQKEVLHLAKTFVGADGKAKGVVAISLRVDWLSEKLTELPLPAGTSATIADRTGTILARYPDPQMYVGRKIAATAPLSLEGTTPGVGEVTGADGKRRMAAWIPPGAEAHRLFVGVGLDRDTLYAEITNDNRIGLSLIVAVTILSLLVTGAMGTRLIRRPLLRLLAITDRWRAGDLGVRTGMKADGSEFGQLASALDAMAETLQWRDAGLRESEERLRLAMVTARLGVRELDLVTGHAMSSPEAEAIFGADAERDSSFEGWLEQVHPDDRDRIVANWERARAAPGVDIEHEYRFCRPDGNWRWIAAHGRLVFKDGKPIRTIGVIQDVTERRRLEGELRALTRGLETRVQAEIVAREAAQVRAAHGERMQALGQLAGGIAHDINNVLQAIGGALRLIDRRLGDPEGVRRLVQLAGEATERGASVTRRLLAFGRRADLRTESIDAQSLLQDLREILVHTLGAAIEVRIQAEPGLAPFTADRSQLETSLINLATNARDAMPDGGTLILSSAAETVAAGADRPGGLRPGNYVRLSIQDTGIGMDEAVLARASEPFFTTKRDGAGTGLGLAMAKGFAEQSGGHLLIESSADTGTCVTIWLPEAAVPALPRVAEARLNDANSATETALSRILLVDDDEAVRNVLMMELEAAGYSVLSASSGARAIEILESGAEVDALVTDLSLPGMDGLAIIRAVRECRPGLPAILLTGYAGDGAALAVGGIVQGTFSLLRKPVAAVQLIDRLETLLADHSPGYKATVRAGPTDNAA